MQMEGNREKNISESLYMFVANSERMKDSFGVR